MTLQDAELRITFLRDGNPGLGDLYDDSLVIGPSDDWRRLIR
jgi:hypothetical protein